VLLLDIFFCHFVILSIDELLQYRLLTCLYEQVRDLRYILNYCSIPIINANIQVPNV